MRRRATAGWVSSTIERAIEERWSGRWLSGVDPGGSRELKRAVPLSSQIRTSRTRMKNQNHRRNYPRRLPRAKLPPPSSWHQVKWLSIGKRRATD